jgi:hypothetical protein
MPCIDDDTRFTAAICHVELLFYIVLRRLLMGDDFTFENGLAYFNYTDALIAALNNHPSGVSESHYTKGINEPRSPLSAPRCTAL